MTIDQRGLPNDSVVSLREKMVKWRNLGMSFQKIADHFGISKGMAYLMIKKGYTPRTEELRSRLHIDIVHRDIPKNKITICAKTGCSNEVIKWCHNRKYCDIHTKYKGKT